MSRSEAGPGRLRVASAQYPIGEPRTLGQWRDKQSAWIADGAATGAALLVLPEYGLMELAAVAGRTIAGDLAASLAAVADAMTEVDAVYADLAQRHRVHVLAPSGPARHEGGRFVNAVRLHTPTGTMGIAEKRIMTPFERAWGISSGHELPVFKTALGRIGVAICYDSEFPLLVRALAEAGAEIVLVPSCTERISGYNRVRTAAMARALENGIATVVSPLVGEAPWSPAVDANRGAAGVYVPAERGLSDTGVLAEGQLDAAQWVTAEIDLAALRTIREGGEMRNARDWPLQPGAAPMAGTVEVVELA